MADEIEALYADLAEPDRAWLTRAAGELRAKLRRTVEEVVASGRLLAQARRRLGRARWRPWLAAEAQIPPRSASRLVAVGAAFGAVPDQVLARFTPTALYALAEPGVPRSLREFFVEQAADGRAVTASEVAEMVALQRDSPDAPLKLATEDETPDDSFVDPAEVFAADNWRLLCALVGTRGTLHLAATPDAEHPDEPTYAGVHLGAEGKRKAAAGGTLETVVLHLSGGVRKKVCARCGENKPLDEYCRRSDLADGREYRCKVCERARVAAHTERKRAAQEQARAAAAG